MPVRNPYSAPTEIDERSVSCKQKNRPSVGVLVGWPLVLAANLVVPLMFGAELLRVRGWSGMIVAVLMFLVAGWWLCFKSLYFARRLIFGGLIVASMQVFPVLQIVAGVFAVGIVELLGIDAFDDSSGNVSLYAFSIWGITMMTGIFLAVPAYVIGWGLSKMLFKRADDDAGRDAMPEIEAD